MDSREVLIEELKKQLDRLKEIRERGLLSGEFKVWYNKCISTIEEIFGADSSYVIRFKAIAYSPAQQNARTPEGLKRKAFFSGLFQASELIKDCLIHSSNNQKKLDTSIPNSIQFIENLCNRFHRIVRQLCTEYRSRKLISI